MKTPVFLPILLVTLGSFFACEKDQLLPHQTTDNLLLEPSHALSEKGISDHVEVTYFTAEGERLNKPQATDNDGCSVVVCEMAINAVSAELEALADATGEIQYTSVECCLDGQTVYAMLIAYPMMYPAESEMWGEYTEENRASGEGLRPSFDYDISVIACFSSGFDLSVRLPDDIPDDFYYVWSLDGEPAGDTQGLSCVCGTHAKVTVARYSENIPLTKSIVLPKCTNVSQQDGSNTAKNSAY